MWMRMSLALVFPSGPHAILVSTSTMSLCRCQPPASPFFVLFLDVPCALLLYKMITISVGTYEGVVNVILYSMVVFSLDEE